MNFKGEDLDLARDSLQCYLSEIKNQIVTCPFPEDPEYAQRLQEYKDLRQKLIRLLNRVTKAIDQREARGENHEKSSQ